MSSLMLLLAKAIPFNVKLDVLEQEISHYKMDPTPDGKQRIATACMLISTEVATAGKELQDVLADFDKTQKARNLLTPKEN